jgi:hypothetical protein
MDATAQALMVAAKTNTANALQAVYEAELRLSFTILATGGCIRYNTFVTWT